MDGSLEKSAKRLIVCCDGTWQSADTGAEIDPTNVANLVRALTYTAPDGKSKTPQIAFYQAGVGTGALSPLQRLLDGMYHPHCCINSKTDAINQVVWASVWQRTREKHTRS